jgi:CRP-like cAMP-binding protein
VDPLESRSVLHEVPLFSELDDDELREILSLVQPRQFDEGQAIFRQGDEVDGMYVIERGRVRISARLLDEDEVELATLGRGAVLGEFSLVDRGSRSATAQAIEPSSGLFFSNLHFDVLRADLRPAAFKTMRRISRALSERLRSLDSEIGTRLGRPMVRQLPPWVHEPTIPLGEAIAAEKLDRRTLGVLPFFRLLTPEEFEEILGLPAWRVPKGRILFRQGNPANSCFLIVRGAIQVALEKGAGYANLAVLGPGQIFGVALMGNMIRAATCYAREQTVVLEIDSAHFDRFFEGSSSVAFKFFDTLNKMLISQLRSGNRMIGRIEAQREPSE